MNTRIEASQEPISLEALTAERNRNHIERITRAEDGSFSVDYGWRGFTPQDGRVDFRLGKYPTANQLGRKIFQPSEAGASYKGTEALYVTPYGNQTYDQTPEMFYQPILLISPSGDLLGQILYRGQDLSTVQETTEAVTIANAAIRIYSGAQALGENKKLKVKDNLPNRSEEVKAERARQTGIMLGALGGFHARLQGRTS